MTRAVLASHSSPRFTGLSLFYAAASNQSSVLHFPEEAYFDTAIINAIRQILGGFGVIFILAFIMWSLSQRRQGMGGGWLGNTYYYIVAPGVMFHELGHALECWLTFTPVRKISLFWPKGDRLGYVAYAMPLNARFASLRTFIISTGPVWLGCAAIFVLGWIMAGTTFWPSYPIDYCSATPGIIDYSISVFFSALHMFTTVVCVWNWTSPFYILLLYLLFCITSEMTLSPVDLAGMWRGAFFIVIFIMALNLIPGVTGSHSSCRMNWHLDFTPSTRFSFSCCSSTSLFTSSSK